jgi:hypothetical protein
MEKTRPVSRGTLTPYISPKVQDKMFMDECYEIAFGNGAISKRYTHTDVLKRLKEQANLALRVETIQHIMIARKKDDYSR